MSEPIKRDSAADDGQEFTETPAAAVDAYDAVEALPGDTAASRATVGLPTRDRSELSGHLIVLEGTDGSGRSTQIALLTEWLESQGFAVQTMGLRRSFLIAKDIDGLLAKNSVTRYTLALMYATDFFDQLENRILPALRSGMIVLADRYYYTLIVRAAVRGLDHGYLHRIYDLALPPDLTFFLNVRPQISFEREFQKSPAISFWEAGRDLHLSDDLYDSFISYQTMIRKEFVALAKHHGFTTLNGENPIRTVNADLRKRIASYLGIRNIRYRPSHALVHLWQ
jgi:dTMP kinase